MYELQSGQHEGCMHMQVLEVLHKASQAVKVTWKADELDKENKDPMPASGTQTVPAQAALRIISACHASQYLLTARS